jgi:hypothetical protein
MHPHPPKPRLTLRVGITGHRPNKLDDQAVTRIQPLLRYVFAAIEKAAADLLSANAAAYASEPPVIRLSSGFAEGADQMAVAACPGGWQVEAILPFPLQEFLKDFETSARDGRDVQNEFKASLKRAAAVTELPYPKSGERQQGYVEAGGYLLRQVDLLVAAWDGLPPSPGGTGALVKEAHEGGIPVVWLATREDKAPRLISGFDEDGTPIAPDADCTGRPLLDKLSPIFAVPGGGEGQGSHRPGQTGIRRFFAESWHSRCHCTAYDTLKRIANRQLPRFTIRFPSFESRRAEWEPFIALAPPAKDLHGRIREILLPRFLWADMLAVYYSHLYRSAYVLAYVLSAFAVFIALIAVFIEHDSIEHALRVKAVLVVSELVAIGMIIGYVAVGRRRLWHERWLDYRALAEMLRHGRFLAFTSEFGRIQASSSESQSRETPWMLGYIRATMREIGLPTAVLDGSYQGRVRDATLKCEILGGDGQLAYHRGNSKTCGRIERMLHVTGILCFFVTFAVLFAFLTGYLIELRWHPAWLHEPLVHAMHWITYFTAGLPALGAAVSGIRVHGDFESSLERSLQMVDQLEALKLDYETADGRDIGLDRTAEMLISTARIMSEDLDAWQELYGRKRLILPG